MSQSLDTDRMYSVLIDEGIDVNIDPTWTSEERYNRLIHLYDVFIVNADYQDRQETAQIVYSQRKFRGQKWIHKS